MKVEIFAAGDGTNYPAGGELVTVHYTGYVSYVPLPASTVGADALSFHSLPMEQSSIQRMIEVNH